MSHYGTLLRLTTFGESHCMGVGGILEGFPSNFKLDINSIQKQLDRRRATGLLSTSRQEMDRIEILSGLENGITLGTPIGFLVKNKDIKPEDYHLSQGINDNYIPRPSHADFTYIKKYGIHASSGGGRSSARETISRVIGGAIAEQYLKNILGCTVIAWVSEIGDIALPNNFKTDGLTKELIDKSELRCPCLDTTNNMIKLVTKVKSDGDSVGGIISAKVINPPIGLGEPCFNKIEALLAHAMLSIPATKGFEIGEGFSSSKLRGSEHNDMFIKCNNDIRPGTNKSGGTLGGITSGEPIHFRVAFKPPSTISKVQPTVNINGDNVDLEAKGRHDPNIVHRAVAIIEGMAALTILDQYLIQKYRSI